MPFFMPFAFVKIYIGYQVVSLQESCVKPIVISNLKMTTYTKEQLIIFDKILKYYYDHYILRTEKRNPNYNLFSNMFNIDNELSKFCINKVCEYGQDLKLLNNERLGYGGYVVVKLHKTPTDYFINQGGFLKHFEEIYEEKKEEKDFKKFERVINTRIIVFSLVVLILSFLITIFTTFCQKQNDVDDIELLKTELKNIEKRINTLEGKKPPHK